MISHDPTEDRGGIARLAGMHAAAAVALDPDIIAEVIARCHGADVYLRHRKTFKGRLHHAERDARLAWEAPVNETWVALSQYHPELVRVSDEKSAIMGWAASHRFAGGGAENVVAELLLDWMHGGRVVRRAGVTGVHLAPPTVRLVDIADVACRLSRSDRRAA